MNADIQSILDRHQSDLDRINNQRRVWLYASSVVVCCIVFLIFGWDWLSNLNSKKVWWLIVSLMLVISVNWWYWTMRVIKIILKYQSIEYDLLQSIMYDIDELRVVLKSQELDKYN